MPFIAILGKIENKEKMLTTTKVAQYLNISTNTLNAWYRFYQDDSFEKPNNMPKLPSYYQERVRGTKYWQVSDLWKLDTFKAWLPKGRGGIMGDYNRRFWGERGKQIAKNKAEKKAKEKHLK